MLQEFFPHGMARYLIGGGLIGLSIALLYVTTGRLGGASTVFSATWSWFSTLPFFRQAIFLDSRHWRLVYALGMVLGGALFLLTTGHGASPHLDWWRIIIGGLLVGFGARLGGGCTSGHGICGIASLSGGSVAVVVTFLTTAIVTALIIQGIGL